MHPLIIGNWKMYLSVAESVALAERLTAHPWPTTVDLVVCPSFSAIDRVRAILPPQIAVGAQDAAADDVGAFTGAVGARSLGELGCHYVIVGHSERRRDAHEDDAEIRRKIIAVRAAGLTPILCIGETSAERRAGEAAEVVRRQLTTALLETTDVRPIIIAYEPVWAISAQADKKIASGTTPEQALAEMIPMIQHTMTTMNIPDAAWRFLYGGSVTPENASALRALPGVTGCLVGAASTDAVRFQSIVAAFA